MDAHPDVSMVKDQYPNAHAMVLGSLLGYGDASLSDLMKNRKFQADEILYVGLQGLHDYDYSQAPVVRIYQPKENAVMTAKIPDIHGNTVCEIQAVKKNGEVQVTAEGTHGEIRVEIFEGNEKKEMLLKA